jgi:hypothetical protein
MQPTRSMFPLKTIVVLNVIHMASQFNYREL